MLAISFFCAAIYHTGGRSPIYRPVFHKTNDYRAIFVLNRVAPCRLSGRTALLVCAHLGVPVEIVRIPKTTVVSLPRKHTSVSETDSDFRPRTSATGFLFRRACRLIAAITDRTIMWRWPSRPHAFYASKKRIYAPHGRARKKKNCFFKSVTIFFF